MNAVVVVFVDFIENKQQKVTTIAYIAILVQAIKGGNVENKE